MPRPLRRSFVWLLCLLCLCTARPLLAQSDAEIQAEWLKGFGRFEAAQAAERSRRYEEAYSLFGEALAQYEVVKTKYPKWNPFLIDYRITDCRKQMDRLEPTIRKLRVTTTPEKSTEVQETQELQLRQAIQKHRDLENKLTQMASQLAEARAEAAKGAQLLAESEKLAWTVRELEKEKQGLQRKVTELNEAVEKPREEVNQLLLDMQKQWELAKTRADEAIAARTAADKELEALKLETRKLAWERAQELTALEAERQSGKVLAGRLEEQGQALIQARQQAEEARQRLARGEETVKALQLNITELNGLITQLRERQAGDAAGNERLAEQQAEVNRLRELMQKLLGAQEELRLKDTRNQRELDALQVANQRLRNELVLSAEQAKKQGGELALLRPGHEQLRLDKEQLGRELAASQARLEEQLRLNRALQQQLTGKPSEAPMKVDDGLRGQAAERLAKMAQAWRSYQAVAAAPDGPAPWESRVAVLSAAIDERVAQAHQLGFGLLPGSGEASETLPRQLAEREAELARLRQQLAAAGASAKPPEDVTALAGNAELARQLTAREQELTQLRAELKAAESAGLALRQQSDAAQAAAMKRLRAAEEALAKRDLELTTATQGHQEFERQRATLTRELEDARTRHQLDKEQLNRHVQKLLSQVADLNEKLHGHLTTPEGRPVETTALTVPVVISPAPDAPPVPEPAEALARQIQDWLYQAAVAERQSQVQGARAIYQRILEREPHQLTALVRLGQICAEAGQFPEAEQHLLKAFYRNPDDKDVLIPLGFVLIRQEKADLGISMLSRAVALFPQHAEVHRYLGVGCHMLGWHQAAERQFLRSWALDEKSADTAFNLAVLYAALEPPKWAESRRWYELARQLGVAVDPGLEKLLAGAPPAKP